MRNIIAAAGGTTINLNPEHWFVSFVSTPFGGGVVFVLAITGAIFIWKKVS